MNLHQILTKQLIKNVGGLGNRHTYIIKKEHLRQERQLSDQKYKESPLTKIQIRSKSQNRATQYNKRIVKIHDLPLQDDSNFNKMQTMRVRSIKNQRKTTPRKKHKSVQQQIDTITPQMSIQISKSITDYNLTSYLQYIRAQMDEQYKIKLNFQSLRRRGRRDGIREKEKNIINSLVSILTSIYENLSAFTQKSKKIIQDNCRIYLQSYQKAKVEIILSIYYPKLLHTKLRPYLVHQRQAIYFVYILNASNKLEKLSLAHLDSVKLSIKYIKDCLLILIEPILQMQEQVVSRINQTFRVLKAVGEVEKKILVIEKQMNRMYVKANRSLLEIQNYFYGLMEQKQDWMLERLFEKQMEISWKFLNIPPIPYLPLNKKRKPYTLVMELDQTIIYYDQINKTLKYRPYIDILLNKLKGSFQMVIFTTAPQQYAKIIVDQIEKVGKYFEYILSQAHLIIYQGSLVKDFGRLGRDLKRLIIVDHVRPQIKRYLANYIKLLPWVGDKTDKWLHKLIHILQDIKKNQIQDIRQYLRDINSNLQMIDQIQQEESQKDN